MKKLHSQNSILKVSSNNIPYSTYSIEMICKTNEQKIDTIEILIDIRENAEINALKKNEK